MIQGPSPLYGLDEELIDDPTVVNFTERGPFCMPHSATALMCGPGNMLARRELRLFLEEWLRKIPDFAIKSGQSLGWPLGYSMACSSCSLNGSPSRPPEADAARGAAR